MDNVMLYYSGKKFSNIKYLFVQEENINLKINSTFTLYFKLEDEFNEFIATIKKNIQNNPIERLIIQFDINDTQSIPLHQEGILVDTKLNTVTLTTPIRISRGNYV